MRICRFLLATLFMLSCCPHKSSCQEKTVAGSGADTLSGRIAIYEEKDLEILNEVITKFNDSQASTADLMLKLGDYFLNSPYVEHSLEYEPEALVVNLREFDCTTFVESCLAISRSIRSGEPDFEHFTSQLRNIRYRRGSVDDYASRIHYFSDWIYLNNQKQIISNISEEVGGSPVTKEIHFMSTHPDSYRQLAGNPSLIETIAGQEREISTREMFYVSKDRVSAIETELKEGDIVGITTSIKGLDIIHTGILVRKSGRIHLLHASSRYKQVLISEETLEVYLRNSKSATGIMVARPL